MGAGASSSASVSSGYSPSAISPVAGYKQGCTNPLFEEYDPSAVDVCPEAVYAMGNCFGTMENNYEQQLCKNRINPNDLKGCTDPDANNYDPLATEDNGTCEFDVEDLIFGCTDESANNYDPTATSDDGSCEFDVEDPDDGDVLGCTCEGAQNYDPNATIDDGSCKACTNPNADNYVSCPDVFLEDDPNSCSIGGCLDPSAVNYNPDATYDDGSCAELDDGGDAFGGGGSSQQRSSSSRNQQSSGNRREQDISPNRAIREPATSLVVGFDGENGNNNSVSDARKRVSAGEFC